MEINDTLNILNLTQAEITALGSVDAGTIVYNSTTNALETCTCRRGGILFSCRELGKISR